MVEHDSLENKCHLLSPSGIYDSNRGFQCILRPGDSEVDVAKRFSTVNCRHMITMFAANLLFVSDTQTFVILTELFFLFNRNE